jgi:phospholipid/cholesterol/gamma-HCH transport system substrate-binding protein
MQSLKMPKALQSPVTWGAGAIAFATTVALVLAWLYVNPPGKDTIVTFYTDDAASMGSGAEVRMAGITVGTVEDISLEADRVRVRARIRDDAFVGEQSQVDVRMLTVVGGYYVNINSIGDKPLGAESIPLERVTMPYSLIETLEGSTKITNNIRTKPLEVSLNEIQQGLTGTNVEALSSIVEAGNSIMSSIERQRGQVSQILDLADEYSGALADYREGITALVRKISILTQTLTLYSKGLAAQLQGLGDTLVALKPVVDFYEAHRVQFVEKVRQYQHRVRLFVERNGVTVRTLQRLQNLFDRVLNAENASPGLLATDLCVPVPGAPC